jgi:putative glycosyltransferase (TIGR04372 family)
VGNLLCQIRLFTKRSIKKIISFIAVQAAKSIERPWRLLAIPFYLFVRPTLVRTRPVIVRVGHAVYFTALKFIPLLGGSAGRMPKAILRAEAAYQFLRGQQLLGENKPEESWRALEQCVKHSGNPFHFLVAGVCLYTGLGRMRDAIELFRESNRIRLLQTTAGGDAYERYCVLDQFWTAHIGHSAEIDYVTKLRILEGRNPQDTILYNPPGTLVANPFWVQQWTPHVRRITDHRELPFPEKDVKYLALDHYVPGVVGTGRHFFWETAARTYQRWAAEARGTLLELGDDVRERGRQALASIGMPPNAWFVGLHVREPGFQPHHRGLHGVLNANIEDYLLAIDEIVCRGGWIIRMGDPSMTPLPPLPNVLDYCHSAIRSDWMDVFIAAASRLFIGTSSGVCYVAQDYGVPCVLTNWWPPAQRPWHAGDIFVPKLIRRVRDGRALGLAESLNEPFGYGNSEHYLREREGVIIADNDPLDIRAAVVEMVERLEGQPSYEASDLAMRAQADKIYADLARRLYDSPAAFGAGSLARDFLRRNPSFLHSG